MSSQLRRHRVISNVAFPRDLDGVCIPLVGYSSAEIEGVVLLAAEYAQEGEVTATHFADALRDYLPSRDVEMIEYMELIAVFEASNRRMLPRKYANLGVEELQARLTALRARVGSRR